MNGYGAVREKLDENNTLTVKQHAVNEKSENKSVLISINLLISYFYNCMYIYIYVLKTMALYSASDFTGFSDSYAVPAGSSDVIFTGSVDLILSIGIAQQVFGTLSTALKCIHFMEQQKLYSLSPDEGVTIINLRSELMI